MTCVCVFLGASWEVLGRVGKRIGFGLYQSWRNRESGICICVLVAVVWVVLGGSGWSSWARVCDGGVVLSLCLL